MSLEDLALDTLEKTADDSQEAVVDELVKDFPNLAGALVKTINRKTGSNLQLPKKERNTNNKLLQDLTSNLTKINGELIIVNSRLQAFNDLIRGSLYVTTNAIGDLEYTETNVSSKLDLLLNSINAQIKQATELEEDRKRQEIEASAEKTEDTAFTFGPDKKRLDKEGKPWWKKLLGMAWDFAKDYITRSAIGKLLKGALPFLIKRVPGASFLSKQFKKLPGANWLSKQAAKYIDPKNSKFSRLGRTLKHFTPGKLKNFGADKLKSFNTLRKGSGNFGLNRLFGRGVRKEVTENLTKKATQQVVKKTSAKVGIKATAGKIPIVSLLPMAWFATEKALKGDWTGMGLEILSGLLSTVPGKGTAASYLIDAGIVARDASMGGKEGGGFVAPPILGPASTMFEGGGIIGEKNVATNDTMLGELVLATQLFLKNISSPIKSLYSNQVQQLREKFPASGTGIVNIEGWKTGGISLQPISSETIIGEQEKLSEIERSPEADEDRTEVDPDQLAQLPPHDFSGSRLEEAILSFRKARFQQFGVSEDRVASDQTFNLAVRELRGASGGSSINPLADDLSYQDVHKGWAHKEGVAFDIPVANDKQAKFVIQHFKSRGFTTLYGREYGLGQEWIDTSGGHDHHVHIQPRTREDKEKFIKPGPKEQNLQSLNPSTNTVGNAQFISYATKHSTPGTKTLLINREVPVPQIVPVSQGSSRKGGNVDIMDTLIKRSIYIT